MSINVDELFPLTQLSDRLPKRNGKKVHFATLYRWSSIGCRGRKLRTVRIGNVLYTDTKAVEEFLVPPTSESKSPAGSLSARRQAEISRAEAELDAAGI